MSSRTRASSPGGHDHFSRIPPPAFLSYADDTSSVANRAFATPKFIHFRSRVDRLGLLVGTNRVNGNVEIGLYGPAYTWARVCLTAPIAVAGMTANKWNWYTPTTTPTINPGLYWAVAVCDTSYVAATSGMLLRNWATTAFNNVMDTEVEGLLLSQLMNGAYPLPDPFVPVNESVAALWAFSLRVSVV